MGTMRALARFELATRIIRVLVRELNRTTVAPRRESLSTIPSDAGVSPTDGDLETWSEDELEEEGLLENNETVAMIGSMLVHVIVILSLALVPLATQLDEEAVVIVSQPPGETLAIVEKIDTVSYSDVPQTKVGATAWPKLRWLKPRRIYSLRFRKFQVRWIWSDQIAATFC